MKEDSYLNFPQSSLLAERMKAPMEEEEWEEEPEEWEEEEEGEW